MKRTKSMVYEESVAASELVLYTENLAELYFGTIKMVLANLKKKVNRGVYDSNKAVDIWYHVVTEASKRYNKEFGYTFTVTERFTAAVDLEENYREELGLV